MNATDMRALWAITPNTGRMLRGFLGEYLGPDDFFADFPRLSDVWVVPNLAERGFYVFAPGSIEVDHLSWSNRPYRTACNVLKCHRAVFDAGRCEEHLTRCVIPGCDYPLVQMGVCWEHLRRDARHTLKA